MAKIRKKEECMIMEGSLNILGLKLNCLMPLKLHTIACAGAVSHYFGFSFNGFPKLVWN